VWEVPARVLDDGLGRGRLLGDIHIHAFLDLRDLMEGEWAEAHRLAQRAW
jgi:hypothetical protein